MLTQAPLLYKLNPTFGLADCQANLRTLDRELFVNSAFPVPGSGVPVAMATCIDGVRLLWLLGERGVHTTRDDGLQQSKRCSRQEAFPYH